jgi:hypothetical protein
LCVLSRYGGTTISVIDVKYIVITGASNTSSLRQILT